ncbi:metal-dependent hydrolase [Flammeovirga sp. SJP92]|uniref:metal-dependent hydrolase n=1 Tax=Flammeovirga sp. SJP92 TaxID=1775430 RepID=UPI0007876E57|nr:metal-dependent hydrolase [Flammeovirga sp. SJP92]KXX69783.1 hypothetical protein AVL50_12905 [Flammeovirga sp. SJP92]
MDILTHTLSGVAVGTVASSFDNSGFTQKLKIILLSGIAGALPDLDAISLWSGFDSTLGTLFNLSTSGRDIYSAKFWYSHHAFLHSAVAGLLITGVLGVLFMLLGSSPKSGKKKSRLSILSKERFTLTAFFFGFLMHLIEDMPTPASTWGGVNLLWPSNTYIGGFGYIWWWNNYDIFLIVVSVIIANILLMAIGGFLDFNIKRLTVMVFTLGFILAVYQIKTRGFDFAYKGRTVKYQEYETKSKEIQKEILGEKLYTLMESFDNKLRIYF